MQNKIIISEFMMESKVDELSRAGEVLYDPDLWKKQDLEREVSDANVLIVRNQTNVNRSLINAAKELKIIGRLGVGLDNIDVNAAKQNDILVIYAKNANAISVAEYILGAILEFSRRLTKATIEVKNGQWDRKKFTLSEVYNKTLGLIGVGEISARVAFRARAFGMNIIGYDPFLPPYEQPITDFGVQLQSFEDVIQKSDFLSLHIPLTEATRNMFSAESLKKMKSTAYIINTSRGGIIDENALFDALSSGDMAGAALDVFENEPPQGSPLLKLDNVILTPHIAGLTYEAQLRTSTLITDEILKVLQGGQSLCVA